jgi:hypothetical protein
MYKGTKVILVKIILLCIGLGGANLLLTTTNVKG